MRYPDEGEHSPPLPWIEDHDAVEDALRNVVISHGGEREGDDGGNGGDGDSTRRSRRGRAA